MARSLVVLRPDEVVVLSLPVKFTKKDEEEANKIATKISNEGAYYPLDIPSKFKITVVKKRRSVVDTEADGGWREVEWKKMRDARRSSEALKEIQFKGELAALLLKYKANITFDHREEDTQEGDLLVDESYRIVGEGIDLRIGDLVKEFGE